jgi:hypothetical protein
MEARPHGLITSQRPLLLVLFPSRLTNIQTIADPQREEKVGLGCPEGSPSSKIFQALLLFFIPRLWEAKCL